METIRSIVGKLGCLASLAGFLLIGLVATAILTFNPPVLGWLTGGLCSTVFIVDCRFDVFDLLLKLTLLLVVLAVSSIVLYPVPNGGSPLSRFGHLLEFAFGLRGAGAVIRRNTGHEELAPLDGGVLIVESDAAVLLSRGQAQIVRGPGVHLPSSDRLQRVLDLRPQMRELKLDPAAETRDGFPILVDFTITFAIDAGAPPSGQGRGGLALSPTTQASILDLLRTSEPALKSGSQECHDWHDEIQRLAERAVRQEVELFSFDELVLNEDRSREPRRELREKIVECLTPQLNKRGVALIGLSIGAIRPESPQMIGSRILNWVAEKRRQAEAARLPGSGPGKRSRPVEEAEAQIRMLVRLTADLQDCPAEEKKRILEVRLARVLARKGKEPPAPASGPGDSAWTEEPPLQ